MYRERASDNITAGGALRQHERRENYWEHGDTLGEGDGGLRPWETWLGVYHTNWKSENPAQRH